MTPPGSESEAVARALAGAAERLKAASGEGAGDPEGDLSADDALVLLRSACSELRDADLEVRRARARIAALSVGATVRRARPEAPSRGGAEADPGPHAEP